MDSVLYKIIEIERAAQSISDEASNARKNLPNEIEAEKERLSAEIDKQINQQLDQFVKEETQDELNRIKQIELQQKLQMAALREQFQKNSAEWESEIYETIRKK